MDIVRFSYYMFIILLILTIIRTEPNLRNYKCFGSILRLKCGYIVTITLLNFEL